MQPDAPKRWHTREDSGLRLDRELRWWHDGERIDHPKIIEAFNVGLQPTDDGRFKLSFGWDWCFVDVEDAAYAVLGVDALPDGRLCVALSDRTSEILDPQTLELSAEGVVHCRVKDLRARARFSRAAQFSLGEMLVSGNEGPELRIAGRGYPIREALNDG
jgi:uncharacterized protein